MTSSHSASPLRHPGRWLVALGFGIAALGIATYIAQVVGGHLKAPWYLPITGMLGMACLVVALRMAPNVWRILGLAVLVLISGVELLLLFGNRLPAYEGTRLVTGEPFPAFTTAKADGTPFTGSDLVGDRDTVMVFFRGRW